MNKFQSKISFTKEGYLNIKRKYQELYDSRKGAVETLSRAREMGDLSENGFYKAAKQKVSSIDYNLRRLKTLIKLGNIVQPPKNTVDVGSKVIVGGKGLVCEFHIVGQYESDPLKGDISNKSPIGKALIGKKVGDIVYILTPRGDITYKILKVES